MCLLGFVCLYGFPLGHRRFGKTLDDRRLGTPDHAIVVASSEGHNPDTFVLVPEEHLTHTATWSGEAPEDLIRADMVFFETPAGGAVFSTGSITFCGSLPHNTYDNSISKILANVLDRFLDGDQDFTWPG
jgi:N,N-dimethylformamidase